MAQFNSIALNQASGRIGALVFNKNGTVRALATGKNPNTTPQRFVRSGLASANAGWKMLSKTQRQGWANVAAQISLTNKVGKTYSPTGRRLFISCYQNGNSVGYTDSESANGVGQTPPATPPQFVPAVPGIVGFAATILQAPPPGAGWRINLSGTFELDAHALVIRATPQLSPARQSFTANDFRVLTSVQSGSAMPTPAALEALYTARFGDPQANAQIAFEVFQVDMYGFVGPVSRSVAVVGVAAEAAAPAPAERELRQAA